MNNLKIFKEEEWDYLTSRINWKKSFIDSRALKIIDKPFNTE